MSGRIERWFKSVTFFLAVVLPFCGTAWYFAKAGEVYAYSTLSSFIFFFVVLPIISVVAGQIFFAYYPHTLQDRLQLFFGTCLGLGVGTLWQGGWVGIDTFFYSSIVGFFSVTCAFTAGLIVLSVTTLTVGRPGPGGTRIKDFPGGFEAGILLLLFLALGESLFRLWKGMSLLSLFTPNLFFFGQVLYLAGLYTFQFVRGVFDGRIS